MSEEPISVSDHEFLLAWTQFGGSEESGRLHLGIAKRIGSAVAIGNKFYKPEPNQPRPTIRISPL